MRAVMIAAVAVLIMGAACAVLVTDSEGTDAADADVTIISASGTIGTGVNWSFSNGVLSITHGSGTGTKIVATGLDSDSNNTSGWGSTWKVTFHEESTAGGSDTGQGSGTKATNIIQDTSLTPSDVFGPGEFTVTIQCGISIADGAFASIRASGVSFTTTTGHASSTIGEGAFENCITLQTVNLDNVTAIGTDAFRGCSALSGVSNTGDLESIGSGAFANCVALKSVDIGTSRTVDQTAFQGCTALATINVPSTNTAFSKDDAGLIYSKDYSTLYICPPAKTGTINTVNPAVSTIYLDYAGVDYIIDLDDVTSGTLEFRAITGAKASGIAYSTQSLSQVSSASISGTTFTMGYTLYDGWTVNGTVATVLDGSSRVTATSASDTSLSFTVADGHGYMVYPVGSASVTEDDLRDETEIEGWEVRVSTVVVENDDRGRVADILDYRCSIVGYTGSDTDATLRSTLYNGGAKCTVVGMEAGDYRSITSLTVDGRMTFSDGIFANCNSLVCVSMPEAESISAQMFRYCTRLVSVEAGACTSIGAYAFEGCGSLTSVALGAESVAVGTGAFSNCPSMELLRVGMDTAITGEPGMFVLHTDLDAVFDVHGDNLVISGLGTTPAVSYSGSSSSTGLTSQASADGWASIYIGDSDQMYVTQGTGSRASTYLVVFDSRIGVRVDSISVDANTAIADLPVPSRDGYTFNGWYTDESCTHGFDPESRITGSQVLYADWTRENAPNNTSIYVLTIFATAVIGTVAVLFVNSRR